MAFERTGASSNDDSLNARGPLTLLTDSLVAAPRSPLCTIGRIFDTSVHDGCAAGHSASEEVTLASSRLGIRR